MFRKKKYDFYLAGPMKGIPQLNKPMFTLMAYLLRRKGFTVWSPSEQETYLKLSFAQCMIADLNMVVNRCRKIALLPGWRNSLGGNAETFTAFVCGKEAVEIIPDEGNTDIELVSFNLNDYCLPYNTR